MQRAVIPFPSGGYANEPTLGNVELAAVLEGFWHNAGRLRSMEGRILQALIPHVYGVADGDFGNHELFHAIDGTTYVIARNGNYLWLGIPHSTQVSACDDAAHTLTVTTGTATAFPQIGYLLLQGEHVITYTGVSGDVFTGCSTLPTLYGAEAASWVDWRPLWGDSGTGGYDARTLGDDGIVQVSDTLYFMGGGVPGRWSGFEYHTGLVTSGYGTGNTSRITLASGSFPVRNPFTDPITEGVTVGDTVYFRYDDGDAPVWDMDHGLLVTEVNAAYLTLSDVIPDFAGKGPGGGNAVEYQIVRTCQMGVPAAGVDTSVSATSGGTVPAGEYDYYWRYGSSLTGYKGLMSKVAQVTTTAVKATVETGTGGTYAIGTTAVVGGDGSDAIGWTAKVAGNDMNGFVVAVVGYESPRRFVLAATRLEIYPQASDVASQIADWVNTLPVPVSAVSSNSGRLYHTDVVLSRGNIIVWTANETGTAMNGFEIKIVARAGDNASRTYTLATDESSPGILTINPETAGGVITEKANAIAAWINGILPALPVTAAGAGLGVVVADDQVLAGGDSQQTVHFVGNCAATPPEPHITEVEIWNVPLIAPVSPATEWTEGGTPTYSLRNVLSYDTGDPATPYWDDATAEGYSVPYTLEPDYLYFARPEVADVSAIVRYHGDRLMSPPSVEVGAERLSTQSSREYWPISALGSYGGKLTIGVDEIVDMITEGSTFAETGEVGLDLMVQTRTKTFRIYGTDWTTDPFRSAEAFPVGSIGQTAQNLLGHVYWVSPNGPMRVAVGSQVPESLWEKLWPRGLRASIPLPEGAQNALLAKWRTAVFGEHWLISGNDGRGDKLYCFHASTGTWDTLPLSEPIQSLASWQGSADIGQLTAAEPSAIYRMFAGIGVGDLRTRKCIWTPEGGGLTRAYQSARWTTGPLLPNSDEGFIRNAKLISVQALIRLPYSQQNITLSCYADGNMTTPQWSSTAILAGDNSVNGSRTPRTWYPQGARGTQFAFSLSGEFSYPVEIEALEVAYVMQELRKQ